MDSKKLFPRLAYLVIGIFVLNFLANKFHWYYSIWWFDMPMHFLGGFWLGMVFVWFWWGRKGLLLLNIQNILKAIAWILLIGIAWEFFEYYFINYVAQNSFDLLDTLSDLFFDIFGGLVSVFWLVRWIGLIPTNKVEL